MPTSKSAENVVSKFSGIELRTGWTADLDTTRSPSQHVSEMTRVASFHADESSGRQQRSNVGASKAQVETIRRISVQERIRTESAAPARRANAEKSRTCVLQ